jgi:hypothetical protein
VAPWAVAFILAAAAGPATAGSATAAADHTARQHAAAADDHGLTFGRVVLIVFENKPVSVVLGNPAAPTFNRLARRYASLTRYFAITHPSLPNYLALVSGSTHGITSDCTDCAVGGRNLADTLAHAGKSWKTYAEGLPRPGFTGAFAGRYAKKHNPLLYFRDVLARPARLRRIVPLSHFARDLAADKLPDFSLVVPDLCHDMHDCPVATGDAWLRRFLRTVLRSSALRDGVVFVVFDEDDGSHGGHVAALALGPLVRPGSSSRQRLDHYALLRTIEDGLGLPRLGRPASTRAITGIWRASAVQRSMRESPPLRGFLDGRAAGI